MNTLFLRNVALITSFGFCVFGQVALANSCGFQGKADATICEVRPELTHGGDPAETARFVAGRSVTQGNTLFQDTHHFRLFRNGLQIDQGMCTGALATATMLLGPASCQGEEGARIRVSSHASPDDGNFNRATIKGEAFGAGIVLWCTNGCVDPQEL